MEKGIYREKSIDRVSSPEQLDGYIRVVNPSVWLILSAVLVFLASFILWSAVGTIKVTVEVKGYSDGTNVYCYLDEEEIAKVKTGMETYMGREKGAVESAAEIPSAYEEIAEFLGGEGIAHALSASSGDFKYQVVISGKTAKEGICDVMIVINRMNPIAYLLE